MNTLDQFFRCGHEGVLLVCSHPAGRHPPSSEVFSVRKTNSTLTYAFGTDPLNSKATETSLRNHITNSSKYSKIFIKANFNPKGLK